MLLMLVNCMQKIPDYKAQVDDRYQTIDGSLCNSTKPPINFIYFEQCRYNPGIHFCGAVHPHQNKLNENTQIDSDSALLIFEYSYCQFHLTVG